MIQKLTGCDYNEIYEIGENMENLYDIKEAMGCQ